MPYQLKTLNRQLIQDLKTTYHLDDFFAKLLVAKHFDKTSVYDLMHLEKFFTTFVPLTNLEAAVHQLLPYLKDPDAVVYIFSDYDVDGMTSGYIMYDGLLHLARCNVFLHYPERHEGYGLNMPWCQWTASKSQNYSKAIVITTDNGTNCLEEIRYLQAKGVEVIVTDHHQLLGEMPPCLVVNPQCYAADKQKYLAGCGVAYYFIKMLQNCYGIQDNIKYLDFVTLGTLADMMPMHPENIAYCFYGLRMINQNMCHPLVTLLKNYFKRETYNYKTLALEVNACLNGCSRMGHMAIVKQAILHPEDRENFEALIYYYNNRKVLTKNLYKTITPIQKQKHIFMLETYIGIAGLIANQLLKELQKDIIVFTDCGNYYKGSARGYKGHNLLGCLKQLSGYFRTLKFGGHNAALGIQIDSTEYEAFCEAFETLIAQEGTHKITTWIDFEIPFEQIDNELYTLVNALPYDESYVTEPLFKTTTIFDKYEPTASNPNNAFVTVLYPFTHKRQKIWVENLNKKLARFKQGSPITFVGTLTENFLSSQHEIVLRVKDVLVEEEDFEKPNLPKTTFVLKPPITYTTNEEVACC